MPTIGDTVRLYGEFRDWESNLVDVDSLEVKIYDKEELLLDTINTGIINYEVGKYYVPYTIPNENGGYLTYKFSGNINGEQIMRGGKIPIKFVGD